MADDTSASSSTLQATSHIPISQLTPLLAAPASRSLKAVVTLTWPYSSAKKSVAFLLAEPDFRLRRTRGQVCVQFSGSSAKAIADSGIASGDTLTLSLDGVEFVHDESTLSTPGRGVEFELKYAEKVLLEFQQEGSSDPTLINVDHPSITQGTAVIETSVEIPIDKDQSIEFVTNGTPKRPVHVLDADEFASPAFVKRARTSFGSLWGDDYSLDDGTVHGKGRKRTRLSSNWVVASRSPTPEVEEVERIDNVTLSSTHEADQGFMMTDEGVQTDAIEDSIPQTLLALSRGSMATLQQNQDIQPVSSSNLASSPVAHPVESLEQLTGYFDPPRSIEAQPPASPRLQPLPSEYLDQVSPLLSRSIATDRELSSVVNDIFTNGVGMAQDSSNTRVEDVSNASQTYTLASAADPAFSHMQDPLAIADEVYEPGQLYEQRMEDQYGSWQSVNAHSQPQETDHNEGDVLRGSNKDFDWNAQDAFDKRDDFIPSPEVVPAQHYPDPDADLSGDTPDTPWHPHPSTANYPELDEGHGDNLDSLVRSLGRAHSQSVSRPESAQSVVIDLTESDDEEQEGEEEVGVKLSTAAHSIAENKLQEEYSDEDGGYEDDIEDGIYEGTSKLLPREDEETRSVMSLTEQSGDDEQNEQYSEEEEQEFSDEDDEELDAQGNPYPPGFRDHAQQYDEEEGDDDDEDEVEEEYGEEYDEDEENVAAQASRPKAPQVAVTISLLSSDDEEEGESAIENPIRKVDASSAEAADVPDEDDDVQGVSKNDKLINEEVPVPSSSTEQASLAIHDGTPSSKKHLNNSNAIHDAGDDQFSEHSSQASESTEDELLADVDPRTINMPAKAIVESTDMQVDTELSSISVTLPKGELEEIYRHNEQTHPFGLDGTNDETPQTQLMSRQSPPASIFSNIAQIGRSMAVKSSPPRRSFFSKVFSIDGANDEPEDRISYPSLPPPSPPANASPMVSQTTKPSYANGEEQLPTPDDTQTQDDHIAQENFMDSVAPPEIIRTAVGSQSSNVASMKPEDSLFDGETNAREPPESQAPAGENAILLNDTAEGLTGSEVVSSPRDRSGQSSHSITKDINDDGDESVRDTRLKTPENQTSAVDLTSPLDKFTDGSPRRSHRRTRSTPKALAYKQADVSASPRTSTLPKVREEQSIVGSVLESKREEPHGMHSSLLSKSPEAPGREKSSPVPAPVTSAKTKHIKKSSIDKMQQSPAVILDMPATPKGHDASIELALSSLNSPEHDLRRTPILDLKLRLNRNLRTELEDFKSLKVLRYELSKKLDVLAIATSAPPAPERAKNGPRHYLITFNITDPSIAPTGVTEVQILRPYKEALPSINVGDGVLLRNFSVLALKNKGFGLRSDAESGSWAVFKGDDEVEVKGPPVEFGESERNHITQMKVWYANLDEQSVAKLRRTNGDKGKI